MEDAKKTHLVYWTTCGRKNYDWMHVYEGEDPRQKAKDILRELEFFEIPFTETDTIDIADIRPIHERPQFKAVLDTIEKIKELTATRRKDM